MKQVFAALCTLALLFSASIPAWADTPDSHYYPIEVREYMEGNSPRIDKVYQLSLSDNPGAIPTDEFERNGRVYYLLDMTRKDEVGVDTKLITQVVTISSDTNSMEKILQKLKPSVENTTEDGYSGVLVLDHTSVNVKADGYATKNQTVTATRTYPDLSDADVSFIPKTVTQNGKTLSLTDVKWDSSYQTEAAGAVVRYSATATYSGTTSSRYATGYTVTANYTGEVAKTNCDIVTYTAIFGSKEIEAVKQPEPEPEPETEMPEEPEVLEEPEEPEVPEIPEEPEIPPEQPEQRPEREMGLREIVTVCVALLLLLIILAFVTKKIKERK